MAEAVVNGLLREERDREILKGPDCGHKIPMSDIGAGSCGACYVFNWHRYWELTRR